MQPLKWQNYPYYITGGKGHCKLRFKVFQNWIMPYTYEYTVSYRSLKQYHPIEMRQTTCGILKFFSSHIISEILVEHLSNIKKYKGDILHPFFVLHLGNLWCTHGQPYLKHSTVTVVVLLDSLHLRAYRAVVNRSCLGMGLQILCLPGIVEVVSVIICMKIKKAL